MTVSIDSVGVYDNYTKAIEGTPNGDGSYTVGDTGYGNNFTCDWSLVVNPDPSISGNFNLTNVSNTTQGFVLTATLPTGAIVGPTKTGGYLGDVTYTDTNGDGNLSYDPVGSNPLYLSLIDGGAFQPLNVVSGPAFGNGVTVVSSQVSFGLPGLTQPGPGVAANIGVRIQFSLTAHDHVSIPVSFQVEANPAPEPATVVLMGLGLGGLALLRKRA
ncbi:MAG TPA: PEP-CTERM sorting domain-containing protein [Myxococcota bacterium]|nr:PEP-CTERM sorting domain-containing protein [Myxococcota bacterium]